MKKYTNKKKTAITIAFMGILGLCAVMGMSQKEYKSTYASVEPSTQAVVYNDDDYELVFNLDESNYVFENLYNALTENSGSFEDEITISINQVGYVLNNDIAFQYDETTYIYFETDYILNYHSPFTDDNLYNFMTENDFTQWSIITFENNDYTLIKTAIELDIQANQPTSQSDSIISAITSGLGLAPDVASEFIKGFTAVFWDTTNNSLTRVSNFMLVMLGIAIVMAIIKLSLSLIRSNTGA